MKIVYAVLILAFASSAASAAQVYRGDYPMNGNAWLNKEKRCDGHGHCIVVVVEPEMSTSGAAGAGAGAGGGGGGSGGGAGGK